jgi:calcium/calmodulin-dependent protein kinase I
VKLGINRQTNANVAVKIIRKENLLEVDDVALHQEVEILRSLSHPNIVQCLDFFEEDRHYYVVLEYMSGGELFQRITKRKSYNEKDARDVVKTVLHAIKYCHDRNIVHR